LSDLSSQALNKKSEKEFKREFWTWLDRSDKSEHCVNFDTSSEAILFDLLSQAKIFVVKILYNFLELDLTDRTIQFKQEFSIIQKIAGASIAQDGQRRDPHNDATLAVHNLLTIFVCSIRLFVIISCG
jgi:hypothetical protein